MARGKITDDKFNQVIEMVSIGTTYVPVTSDAYNYLSNLASKEIKEVNGCFSVTNEYGVSLSQEMEPGEIIYMNPIKARDIKFHKAYMAFLGYIWDYLPDKFHEAIPKTQFYLFLKHLRGDYDVRYRFKDINKREAIKLWLKAHKKQFRITYKTIDKIADYWSKMELLEYKSLSFGRMNEDRFHDYIKNQLPFIYSEVIGRFYEGDEYNNIISTIEEEWEKFLSKV